MIPFLLGILGLFMLLKTDFKMHEYIHMLKFDNDSFNKWDAAQNLYLICFFKKSNFRKSS